MLYTAHQFDRIHTSQGDKLRGTKENQNMKTTLTFSAFCDAFRDMGREDQFSYAAKRALFDHLEEVAPDMELDIIALCCEYAESDLDTLISEHCIDVSEAEDDDEKACIVEEYLQGNTLLVARIGTDFLFAQF